MAQRPSKRTQQRLAAEAAHIDPDAAFFAEHPDRLFRIREPLPGASADMGESETEFRYLGPHQRHRRRIIVHNFAKVNPMAAVMRGVRLMRIPFLLFTDETVEDRDDVLGPIFHEIMRNARGLA